MSQHNDVESTGQLDDSAIYLYPSPQACSSSRVHSRIFHYLRNLRNLVRSIADLIYLLKRGD